mmetsp:Transcript_18837/g.27854  ORF Transcript_18837/g.27854 Transcript_18837/m.27854 type:complete len:411 (+) Transcript_18837:105-1337(+)
MTSSTSCPQTLLPQPDSSLSKQTLLQLESFCCHYSQQGPVALVTSGGTAVALDGVRHLENFSSGQRGALSVEEFLKRGYAVVHLWRKGSISPYGRVAQEILGSSSISVAAFSKLLDEPNDTSDEGLLKESDPWLTETSPVPIDPPNKNNSDGFLELHRRLRHDEHLQRAWREYQSNKQRLFVVEYHSVEEYLDRLQICSKMLQSTAGALGLIYLAAAVSDYYLANKIENKIQSSNEEFNLTLQPVPKVLGELRSKWAPDTYVVSFKLETDPNLLHLKAERAAQKYGVHMVIANLLRTRYKEVQVLHPSTTDGEPHQWTSLKKKHSHCLESEIIDSVAQAHFAHLSQSNHHQKHSSVANYENLRQCEKQLQRQQFYQKLQQSALGLGGTLLGIAISYTISTILQKRISQVR